MNPKTSLLHLDALPPKTTRGTLVRLLEQVGQLDRRHMGTIEVRGRSATVEVPRHDVARLVRALDGAQLGNQYLRASLETFEDGERDADQHFLHLRRLLEIEGAAESAQTLARIRRTSGPLLEANGDSLIGLVVRDEHPGLGGRCLVTLKKQNPSQPLPWTRLSVGAPVLLSPQQDPAHGWRAVVSERTSHSIQVALDQQPPLHEDIELWRLDLSSDEVARQRQRQALDRARTAQGDRLAAMRDVLLGERPPGFHAEQPLAPLDPSLNESQQQAVAFALSCQDIGILHGPPGTGKTTTVVEVIRQAIRREQKVLACAPSNLAVDNILERLLAAGEKALRVGHPARVLPELRAHTLDLIVEEHPDIRLANRLARDAQNLRDRAARYTRAKPAPGAKREMYEEAKRLIEDARRLESQVVQEVLDSASVLCVTTTGLDSELFAQRSFDLLVIDEACQGTEPGAWIPLARCDRLILAGDHCQLPPTVLSRDAQQQGLGISLQERLVARYGAAVSRRLTVQYRMHQQIMRFSSDEFYEGSLVADEAVREHRLCDLAGVRTAESTCQPLMFIDTAGAGYQELVEPDGESRFNPQEAILLIDQLKSLLDHGVAPADVAVITPYAAQARHIREQVAPWGIDVDTVDGFQGREREAILISLVRSNSQGEIGFLADTRRMNVALTRARRKLVVIGDSATVGAHPFYQRLLEYFERQAAYHSVWECA